MMQSKNCKQDGGQNDGGPNGENCMPETCSSFGGFHEQGSWEAFDARPLLPKGKCNVEDLVSESLFAKLSDHVACFSFGFTE